MLLTLQTYLKIACHSLGYESFNLSVRISQHNRFGLVAERVNRRGQLQYKLSHLVLETVQGKIDLLLKELLVHLVYQLLLQQIQLKSNVVECALHQLFMYFGARLQRLRLNQINLFQAFHCQKDSMLNLLVVVLCATIHTLFFSLRNAD